MENKTGVAGDGGLIGELVEMVEMVESELDNWVTIGCGRCG